MPYVPEFAEVRVAIRVNANHVMKSIQLWCDGNPFPEAITDRSALVHFCAQYNRLNSLKYLMEWGYTKKMFHLKHGPTITTSLYHAIYNRNLDMIKYLLSLDSSLIHSEVKFDKTPILHALESCPDREEIIKYIIEFDSENKALYIKDKSKRLPIHYAAQQGLSEIVRTMLMRVQSDQNIFDMLDADDESVGSPIHHAVDNGYREIVDICLEFDSNALNKYSCVNKQLSIKRLPIHTAVLSGRIELVQYFIGLNNSLIERLDEQNEQYGSTVMHQITWSYRKYYCDKIAMVQLLVRLGNRSLYMINHLGKTPFKTHIDTNTIHVIFNNVHFTKTLAILSGINIIEGHYYNRTKYPQITESDIMEINFATFFAYSLVEQLLLFIPSM